MAGKPAKPASREFDMLGLEGELAGVGGARAQSIPGEARGLRLAGAAPTSVLGCVCAPGRVVLPEPLHHVLDSPDLLLDLPVEHLVLQQPQSRSKEVTAEECPRPFPTSLKPAAGRSPVHEGV